MSTRLANYPRGAKDKGQSKVTLGDEASSACMNSAQVSSVNILGFPVWTCGCMFFFVFHDQRPGDRWCVGFGEGTRDSLLEKNTQKDIVIIFMLGKRLTNGHRLMAYEREPWQRRHSICTLVQLVAGFTHCLWSLIIYSAWDGLYIPPCLSLTSVMEVISLAVTFCFSVVSLDSLSIFN